MSREAKEAKFDIGDTVRVVASGGKMMRGSPFAVVQGYRRLGAANQNRLVYNLLFFDGHSNGGVPEQSLRPYKCLATQHASAISLLADFYESKNVNSPASSSSSATDATVATSPAPGTELALPPGDDYYQSLTEPVKKLYPKQR